MEATGYRTDLQTAVADRSIPPIGQPNVGVCVPSDGGRAATGRALGRAIPLELAAVARSDELPSFSVLRGDGARAALAVSFLAQPKRAPAGDEREAGAILKKPDPQRFIVEQEVTGGQRGRDRFDARTGVVVGCDFSTCTRGVLPCLPESAVLAHANRVAPAAPSEGDGIRRAGGCGGGDR